MCMLSLSVLISAFVFSFSACVASLCSRSHASALHVRVQSSQYLSLTCSFPSCRENVYCANLTSSACLCRDEGCRGGAPGPQGGFEVQTRRRGTWSRTFRGARPGPGRRGRGHDASRWRDQQRRRIQPGAGQQQRAGEAAATAAEQQQQQQSEPVRRAADPEAEAAPDPLHPGAAQRAGEELRQNALPGHLHAGGAGAEDRADGVQSAGTAVGHMVSGFKQHTETQIVFLKPGQNDSVALLNIFMLLDTKQRQTFLFVTE